MINRQTPAGVFVNQSKGWTSRSRRRAQSGRETFYELRFAAANSAGERKHVARFYISGELATE